MSKALRVMLVVLLPQVTPAFATSADSLEVQPGNMLGASTQAAQQQMQLSKNKNTFNVMTPENMTWTNLPSNLPPGGQYALLEGNPQSGLTTARVKLPAHYHLGAVYNLVPERVTLLSGSINIGVGDLVDTSKSIHLPAGSYFIIPAKTHYYLWTTEDTLLQTTGLGFWKIQYVNPLDDPRAINQTRSPTKPDTQTNGVPTPQNGNSLNKVKTPAEKAVSTPAG